MLYFDIETDGLLDNVTKGHCLVIIDEQNNISAYRPDDFKKGAMRLIAALRDGESICGHNIINYDCAVLAKLYPEFRIKREWRPKVLDTLVLSRLICGTIATS